MVLGQPGRPGVLLVESHDRGLASGLRFALHGFLAPGDHAGRVIPGRLRLGYSSPTCFKSASHRGSAWRARNVGSDFIWAAPASRSARALSSQANPASTSPLAEWTAAI